MLPRLHILIKGVTAVVMTGALLLLVSGNYWAYGFKKEQKAAMMAAANAGEEEGAASPVPNPTEEKTPNGLQNVSEYLHDHSCTIHHPVAVINTGYYS